MPTRLVWAAPPQAGPLLPIGGGYFDTYAAFAEAVVSCAPATHGQRRTVVVLPTAYSSNAENIASEERERNLRDAEARRRQIEEACRRAASSEITCIAIIAPIFTRSDAGDPAKYAPLLAQVSAVFMLGGDQAVAMAALAGTPAEAALAAAHRAGAVIAGTSAGAGMLAAEMLGGYDPGFAAPNSLDFGAADVWNNGECRGLAFGVRNALLDQHFFQRGRMGRLLNAVTSPGSPSVGIGVDAYTGMHVEGEMAGDVFGLYEVAVLDAATYHAAETVQYIPLEDPGRPPVLSLRNVLVHLLAPGAYSYDLAARRHSLAAPPGQLVRDFDSLRLPPGAGTLLLAGGLRAGDADSPVVARFRDLAGGPAGKVLIYVDGYPSDQAARRAGEQLGAALGLAGDVCTASDLAAAGTTLDAEALGAYTGIVLTGRDQSLVDVAALASWLPAAWRSGLPILADDALAPALGAYYSAHGPTPSDRNAAELATQRSLIAGETVIKPGLGLVEATFEPQLLADNRWGRYFSLAYTHPEFVAIGLNRGAGLEISQAGAWALGENVTFALDLRAASLSLGTNGGFVIANGLIDVFAPGDKIRAEVADVETMVPVDALPCVFA